MAAGTPTYAVGRQRKLILTLCSRLPHKLCPPALLLLPVLLLLVLLLLVLLPQAPMLPPPRISWMELATTTSPSNLFGVIVTTKAR